MPKKEASVYERYIEVDDKMKALAQEKESLKARIVSEFKTNGKTTEKTARGIVEMGSRANWVFSPSVEAKEKEVKALKEKEKLEGVAKNEPIDYLTIKLR